MSNSEENSNVVLLPTDYKRLAVEKIAEELKAFKGGNKETAVSTFVAATLTRFCEKNEQFAEVVYKTKKTLSNSCAEVMKGSGNHISDIDVYRGAVRAYFPNADIRFLMEIEINGAAPTEEEMAKIPVQPAEKTTKKRGGSKTSGTPTEPAEVADEDADGDETAHLPMLRTPEIQKAEGKKQTPKKAETEVIQLTLF